ncbi:MAG: LysM peptidoglycan-binding domain-containing protein [bacterium]|nr:LysM peptidoglycan-binding domain-containing protein [bacterium]
MASPKKQLARSARTGAAILVFFTTVLACATKPVAPAEPVTQPELSAPVVLYTRYEVVRGDMLSSIAQNHGITLEALLAENPIDDPRKLEIGRVLRIPVADSQIQPSEFDDGFTPEVDRVVAESPASDSLESEPAASDSLESEPAASDSPTPKSPAEPGEITDLIDLAQRQRQDEDYAGALETLTLAEEAAVALPEDEDSRSTRAQIALTAAMVELGRGDDAGVVQRFSQVLTLLPYYAPAPGVFSPHALELLEQAREEVAYRR